MAIAKAKAFYNFGFSQTKLENVSFLSNNVIAFPSGTCCVLLDFKKNTQHSISSVSQATSITALSISYNKKYLAFAEKNNTKTPEIFIYETENYRKIRILSQEIYECLYFESLSFSANGKILAAISFNLDRRELFVWKWDRYQMIGHFELLEGLNFSKDCYSTLFCPNDNELLSVMSPMKQFLFSAKDFMLELTKENEFFPPDLYERAENNLKTKSDFISQEWLDDKRIVLGTTNNSICILEDSVMVFESTLCTIDMGTVESHDYTEDFQVRSIVKDQSGFWCCCGKLTLHYFEESEEEMYIKSREIKMMSRNSLGDNFSDSTSTQSFFTTISLSPAADTIVAVTDNGQLFSYNVLLEVKWYSEVNFEQVTPLVHTDVITGLDVCVRKPFIATCSLDSTIKIWDYNNFQLKVSKLMGEPLLSITLHPRGHMLVAGTTTNIKACSIFSDDLQSFKSLPVPSCSVCCFSHGGHMFAVARMNIVEIYSSLTFQLVSLFKTHLDMVKSMCWTDNDGRMVSAGRDGAIYEWEVLTGKRYSENVLKGCSYSSIVLKNKSIFAIGADVTIKQIVDSQIITDINCGSEVMTQITMTHNSNVMFVGLETGKIRSMRLPITDPPDWLELHGHCSAIRGLSVTCDDELLISISQDTLCIVWKIMGASGGILKVEKPYTMEILVMPTDVEKKIEMIQNLQLRIEELQSEIPYQVLQKDVSYNESLSDKMHRFFAEHEVLKDQNLFLTKEQKNMDESFSRTVTKIKKKYTDVMQANETQIKQVLMTEFGKYQELKDKDMRMKKEYHRKLEQVDMKIQVTEEKLGMAIELKNNKPAESEYDFGREWQEIKTQVEEDNDNMVMQFIKVSEDNYTEMKRTTGSLKVENYTIRKHIIFLKKSIDENQLFSSRQEVEKEKVITNLILLQDSFDTLKKSVLNKDKLIYEKEEVLNDLRKKNQNLQNSSKILEFRIQEHTKHLEGKQNEVNHLQNSIELMEGEVINMQEGICRLKEMHAKISEKEKVELKKKREAKKELLQTDNSFKGLNNEIFDCTGLLHRHEDLKKKVQAIIRSASTIKKEVAEEDEMDRASYCDFMDQRAYLKKTVNRTKAGMKEQKTSQYQKDFNNMKKNSQHMNEIELLKTNLKKSKDQLKELRKKFYVKRPEIGWKQIQEILGKTVPDVTLYGKVEELKNTIEINSLLMKDLEMENCYLDAGMSKSKVNSIYRKSRKIMIKNLTSSAEN